MLYDTEERKVSGATGWEKCQLPIHGQLLYPAHNGVDTAMDHRLPFWGGFFKFSLKTVVINLLSAVGTSYMLLIP